MAADSKAKLLEEAERYVLHGKIQQAISEYLKVIAIDPNDVLILNTIGDLCLRQNKVSEANKYFSQVAENYVRNNFFLKAIAVYKKILNADPNNLEINSTVASLYARQGLSIDARNQYLRVASLLEQEGKTKESLDAYEKIVELDPSNADIQRKLAALHLAEGAEDKAHAHWIGAAKAQVRSGDFAGASVSYGRALQLVPLAEEAMKGFLECCVKTGNLRPALEQLKKSVEMAPQSLDMREMLGSAYLESGDIHAAAKAFQMVVSLDESRYGNLLRVAQAFLNKGEHDQAHDTLDPIVPILISRRETEKATKIYSLILERHPGYIPALTKLASLYSATGDHAGYLHKLDELADCHLAEKQSVEALECLEKILQFNPESEKHLDLHRQVFAEIHPHAPYVSPVKSVESAAEIGPSRMEREPLAPAEGGSPEVVEVDLLLNYGLKEKALSLLQSLEMRDPYDRDVRVRLLSLYKSEKKYVEAAAQCLLLAALQRRAGNEASAQNYLNEARELDPDTAANEAELEEFAGRNGISTESAAGAASSAAALGADGEVDLSSDLLDVFFSNDPQGAAVDLPESQAIPDAMPEVPEVFSSAPSKSIQEQLQEVDFYIRLGFHDEALGKLNEIAKAHPDHPDLAARYEKLGDAKQSAPEPVEFEDSDQPLFGESAEPSQESARGFQMMEFEAAAAKSERLPDVATAAEKPVPQDFAPVPHAAPQAPARPGVMVNDMFADLMEEVGSSNQDEAMAAFEEHFSLGTAYREMELIEEAIKEFETALKSIETRKADPRVIQCCGMLSTCYLKKNMPRSALRWCQTGLGFTDISSHEAMALRYDMGVAHAMEGSKDRALECFDQIYSADPGYRDVAQRIDKLKGFERHVP